MIVSSYGFLGGGDKNKKLKNKFQHTINAHLNASPLPKKRFSATLTAMSQNIQATPMMRQYAEIKAQYPGYLLFYRMGDFFELFGEDALTAADILQVTLTQRRTSKAQDGIPMCGVPYHAAEGYIAKLINAGHKVALCEQAESPEDAKKRGGAKALVKREVVRLYTGGTLTEDTLLPTNRPTYLAALAGAQGLWALAWLDVADGTFGLTTTTPENLAGDLAALSPGEIVLSPQAEERFAPTLAEWNITVDESFFGDASSLPETSFENGAQELAAAAVVAYAKHTQMGKLPPLQAPAIQQRQKKLALDAATRRHLELTETLQGEKKGSLLATIDLTVTPYGARLLRSWLNAPLTDPAAINVRLDGVETFVTNASARLALRAELKQTADMARALSRLALDRGSPRDLNALRITLKHLPTLARTLSGIKKPPPAVAEAAQNFGHFDDLSSQLDSALEETTLPLRAAEGGFIRPGFDAELDKHRDMKANGLKKLKDLEAQEQKQTGIPSLKLKYNRVWGYFLEVTKTHQNKVPEDYIHRQTTTNSQRFSTAELMTLERDFSAAETHTLAREQQIFDDLVNTVKKRSADLLDLATALATLDALSAGAELAATCHYTRPTVDNSLAFEIDAGRHPVVEHAVENFIANTCSLTDGQLWLITGPNMAGKSTFLRQNALIVILAQTGYFVPARAAHIGVVDRIFTRIGAADDLSRGQSTFMVEMVETAEILNHATPKSLVILDEMGRGTATYDGMSLAWACVEHLATAIGCRGLFATHYHELTTLADQLERLHTYHVTVREWKGDIVFLHDVKPGAAPQSYGIHVAQLAGVPPAVVARARDVLAGLEKAAKGKKAASAVDLPLFTAPSAQPVSPTPAPEQDELQEKLLEIDLDALSPRDAQNLLYDLKIMAAMPSRNQKSEN
jgi:DNA mismatch repair protein MutS